MSVKGRDFDPDAFSDARLMRRLGGGDMDALAVLVERHQQRIRSLAYRMTGRWDAADDIAQDTFLRLYRVAGDYRPTAAFSTWLYRIVVNSCLDHAKRRRLADFSEETAPAGSGPPADAALIQSERVEAVRRAVTGLPERQRIALVLHRFEGLGHEEIAAATGWTVSAVESLLVRAYARLRDELKGWADA